MPKKQAIINLPITDKRALYQAYMPFVKNGGIFASTKHPHKLGDEVFMLITLPEDGEKLPVTGRIIWVTFGSTQGGRPSGVGIQFSEQDKGKVKNRIENTLSTMLNSDRPTYTF